MTIDLLEIGCTAETLIETINKLIALYNEMEGTTSFSYNKLRDLPQINGVTLSGNKTTTDLDVRMSETSDFDIYNETYATKREVTSVAQSATQEAADVANAALATKLNADLSNIESVDAFSGEAYIPVVTSSGVKKTTINRITDYSETRSIARATQLDTALRSERRVIALYGEQSGRNATFTTGKTGYKLNTSSLYLNGQLLTLNTDYEETDSYTITMLTYLPTSEDVLILRAIPLNS